jgi:hypothetical protein
MIAPQNRELQNKDLLTMHPFCFLHPCRSLEWMSANLAAPNCEEMTVPAFGSPEN